MARQILTLLKRERELRNWTQQDVGEKLGVDSKLVSAWERGVKFPSAYYRQKLCKLFGKTSIELGFYPEESENIIDQQINRPLHPKALPYPPIWNVPYEQNPVFTGRESILQQLRDALITSSAAALTQTISGLGGVGKTQIAVEYCYRNRGEYNAVLWANADSREELIANLIVIAVLLKLPESRAKDQQLILNALRKWMREQPHWLLVLDNVESIETIRDIIPPARRGHILLTTRNQAAGKFPKIDVQELEAEEGSLLLLRRANIVGQNANLSDATENNCDLARQITHTLGGLPLALDQAGSYIQETGCSLSDYLVRYKLRRAELLRYRDKTNFDYPHSVATTWSLSFDRIESANQTAAHLLRVCTFLHPDAIPEEIFIEGAGELGVDFQPLVEDPTSIDRFIGEILKYSLIRRNSNKKTLAIHRLVQAVMLDDMDKETQQRWAERIVRALDRIFPAVKFATLSLCERYFPHAQSCAILIERWDMVFVEAPHLLRRAGEYLSDRSQFIQAQQYLERALNRCETLPEPLAPELANCLNSLAHLHEIQENFADAEALYLKEQAICENILKPEDPQFIHLLNSIALLYIKKYKLTEAEPLIQRVLAITKAGEGLDPETYIYSLHIRAEFYTAKGQYTEAEELYRQALALREQSLGLEHPDLSSLLNNLAVLYMLQRKFSAAEPFCQRALAISEKVLGPNHHIVAFHLVNLAAINENLGRYDAAEEQYQRAWRIREETLGSEHPEIGTILNNLGLLYNKQEKFADAERHIQSALAISEKVRGPDHLEVANRLSNLAEVYRKQEKFDEAEPLCQRALAIIRTTVGPEHPEMMYPLNRLAVLYYTREKYIQAAPLYQQTLLLMEKILGPEHPDTARVLWGYAQVIKKLGREDEAQELERRFDLIKAKYVQNPKKYL
jgi:tetratricopeptide (TPR) repeat protein/transcriptional regulator with XRE-family HTH domain